MNIDKNDPRLTAYALGEMDATETAAFEAELDDAARAEIEAIRQVAGRVESEWRDTEVVLTASQRARVASPKTRAWLFPAAAATLLIAVVLAALTSQTHSSAKQTDAHDDPPYPTPSFTVKKRFDTRVTIESYNAAGGRKLDDDPSTGVVHKTLESMPKGSTTAADLLIEQLNGRNSKFTKEVGPKVITEITALPARRKPVADE